MMIIVGLGLIIGLIMALTGAGGGILAVPLLMFGLGLSVTQAGPIGLIAVGISAAVGALLGLKAGMVRYRAALLMAASGMIFSPVGIWLAHRVNDSLMSVLFATILLFVAYRTFQQAHNHLEPHPCEGNLTEGHLPERDLPERHLFERQAATTASQVLPCNLDAEKIALSGPNVAPGH
jgi:uncharacterized protein